MKIWDAKTPGEIALRRWEPQLPQRESLATSATITVDAGTVTATAEVTTFKGSDVVEVLLSGGAIGETARISIDVGTSEGATLTGVFFMAVRSEAPVLGSTARDVCNFALRKVIGNGEVASADELTDALERLNDMLMIWRVSGLDVGLGGVLEADTELNIPDFVIAGLKWNLREELHDFYGVDLTPRDMMKSQEAQAVMRAQLLCFEDLNFDRGLLRHPGGWDFVRGY